MESTENAQNSEGIPRATKKPDEAAGSSGQLTDSEIGAMLPQEINRLLSPLDDREEAIIRFRFALSGEGDLRTYEEVGEHFNISTELVRQIESQAMNKLRHRAL